MTEEQKKVLIATQKRFALDAKESMIKVFNNGNIGYHFLEGDGALIDLVKEIPEYHGLVVRSDLVTDELLEVASNLEAIVRAGSDPENINITKTREKGIYVSNTPGRNANGVAEESIWVMGAIARNLFSAYESMKNGEFLPDDFIGHELEGKRIGLLAFGHIPKLLSKKLSGLGAKVFAYDPFVTDKKVGEEYGATLVDNIQDIFEKSFIVSIHVPNLPDTNKIVNYELLSLMSDNGILLNTARPNSINYDDLKQTLLEKDGFRYASDVNKVIFIKDNEMGKFHDRIFLFPKLGAQTFESNIRTATSAADHLDDYFNKGILNDCVNVPLPEEMKEYALLTMSLGKFNKAFIDNPIKIEIVCYGDLNTHKDDFKQYVLKGLYEENLGKKITPSQALEFATDNNVNIITREPDPTKIYPHSIEIIYHSSDSSSHKIRGRIDEGELQITRVGEFKQNIPIFPYDTIIVQYTEKAGMFDRIGNQFTKYGYNKVYGGFGPNEDRDKAMTFIQVEPNGRVKGVEDIIKDEINPMKEVYRAVNINMK